MTVSCWKGVGMASIAAGPLFIVAAVATMTAGGLPPAGDRPLLAFGLLASVPVGFVLALLPNLMGAVALAALGRGNDGVRLPVFWGLVGAGVGGAIDWAIALAGGTPGFAPTFTLVALASALLCRAGTRWTD